MLRASLVLNSSVRYLADAYFKKMKDELHFCLKVTSNGFLLLQSNVNGANLKVITLYWMVCEMKNYSQKYFPSIIYYLPWPGSIQSKFCN